jgi:2-dehydropantoate 2-reductase
MFKLLDGIARQSPQQARGCAAAKIYYSRVSMPEGEGLMRVLVLGAGGIGGYFGGRLAAAGLDVSFLVRPARAEALAQQGLVIGSALGDLRLPVTTLLEADAPFDAILLACKAYDLEGAMDAVSPAVGPSTLVLPLLNGIRHLTILDARFRRDQVLGGLCHIGVAMNSEGEIRHMNTLQRLVLGARTPEQRERTARLHALMRCGGFAPVLSEAILQDMWEKFVFLAAYAGLTTLMRAPVGNILAAEEGESISCEMLQECIETATASGHAPRETAVAEMRSVLTDRDSEGTASMFRDMMGNRSTEHEHILGDMVARARAAGIATPLLRISLANMQAYEARRLT